MHTESQTPVPQKPNSGCGCAALYLVLSYPLNYCFLKFVFNPLMLTTAMDRREIPEQAAFYFLISPVGLPIELFLTIAVLLGNLGTRLQVLF